MLSTLRRLPTFTHELQLFLRDHAVLSEQVRRHEATLLNHGERLVNVENHLRGLSEQVDRLHQTMTEADPHMAYEIVTSVRDDVRALLVEVTEQANQLRDRLVATPAPAPAD
jgi:hypothetical protein